MYYIVEQLVFERSKYLPATVLLTPSPVHQRLYLGLGPVKNKLVSSIQWVPFPNARYGQGTYHP